MTVPELRSTMRSLVQMIECPVCHSFPGSDNVTQCTNGHVVCSGCKSLIHTCPMCRAGFSQVKPLIFSQLLEILPKKCRFEGCSVILRNENEHESWCGFRPWTCWWCPEESNAFLGHQMLTHVREEHGNILIENNTAVDLTTNVENLFENVDEQDWKMFEKDVPKYALGEFFSISYTYDSDEGCLTVRIGLIPSGDVPAERWLFGTLQLSVDDGTRFSFSKPFSLHLGDFERSPLSVNFEIHENILQDFVGKNKLTFKTSIVKGVEFIQGPRNTSNVIVESGSNA